MRYFLARQMFRQWTARRFLDERLHGGRTLSGADTFVLVQLIELQLKLLDLAGNPLRGLSKLRPLPLGDAGFQLGNLQSLRLDRTRQGAHQRLKRLWVCRQIGEIDVHGAHCICGRRDPPLRTLPRVNPPLRYPAISGL